MRPTEFEALLESLRTDLSIKLRDLMRKLDITESELVSRSGVSDVNIRHLLKGRQTTQGMNLKKLDAVAAMLGCAVQLPNRMAEWDQRKTALEEVFRANAEIRFVERQT
ncbi:MAG TPA: helix-turn-helix domain-containing protein [Candidatus Paceibacterota bacterium]|nr:helix-turn-helix domain-containing protein [Candidatus Paceibacterota bacterium]